MFWQNKKKFDFSSLISDSRNILTASLKIPILLQRQIIFSSWFTCETNKHGGYYNPSKFQQGSHPMQGNRQGMCLAFRVNSIYYDVVSCLISWHHMIVHTTIPELGAFSRKGTVYHIFFYETYFPINVFFFFVGYWKITRLRRCLKKRLKTWLSCQHCK